LFFTSRLVNLYRLASLLVSLTTKVWRCRCRAR